MYLFRNHLYRPYQIILVDHHWAVYQNLIAQDVACQAGAAAQPYVCAFSAGSPASRHYGGQRAIRHS